MSIDVEIVVAIVALTASIFAAVITVSGEKRLRLLEEQLKQQERISEFEEEKLTQLYLPITMHLMATGSLFKRYFKAGEDEKIAIEHEMRIHNTAIRELLINAALYLDDDSPDEMVDKLLEHLIQWEIVYKLKYEYKVYAGPVFAGIDQFGFRGFPKELNPDRYFGDKVKQLKAQHAKRLA